MLVGCACLSFDVLIPVLIVALYFYFGGIQWTTIFMPSLVFPFFSFGLSFLIPESPRYLNARKMFNELRANLKTISRVNGVDMGDSYLIEDEYISHKRSKVNLKSKSPFYIYFVVC